MVLITLFSLAECEIREARVRWSKWQLCNWYKVDWRSWLRCVAWHSRMKHGHQALDWAGQLHSRATSWPLCRAVPAQGGATLSMPRCSFLTHQSDRLFASPGKVQQQGLQVFLRIKSWEEGNKYSAPPTTSPWFYAYAYLCNVIKVIWLMGGSEW